jgi:hypothetical protein
MAPWQRQPNANPRERRLNPVTVGFWLGGFILGIGGAIAGACMPYRHPVAVTISILWWGIFFECFGASIGALFGSWRHSTLTLSEKRSNPFQTALKLEPFEGA